MKDAPINLLPLPDHPEPMVQTWTALEIVTMHKYAQACARAAVLADRAGREAYCPNCDCGYGVGVYQPAAPSAAEFKTILERAFEAVKATKPPAPPNWKEPTEPPAAPVQQEPVAWQDVQQPWDLYRTKPLGIDVRPLYTHPDADLRAEGYPGIAHDLQEAKAEIARLREYLTGKSSVACQQANKRALEAEAERDSLRALLWRAQDEIRAEPEPTQALMDLANEINAALSGSK